MKVLFLAKFDLPDFQSDMIFHGFRSLFGPDVVDYNEAWYMYDDFRNYWADRIPERGMSYGRGFTLYGRLPKLEIDRTDIESKIKNHYFDKIVYGSILRFDKYLPFIQSFYKPDEIICIDGEDNEVVYHPMEHFVYYKRELDLHQGHGSVKPKPINFCIPKELIVSSVPKKEKDYATIIPGDTSTYIYTEEKPYYEDYQKSYFGLTCKKGGWDCLRHYEILMNGCIPWFPNLENCPSNTMTKFPKELITKAMNKIKEGNDLSFYEEHVNMLLNWTRNNLTTEKVVENMILS
jgi:hypothetical protein